mgnify:CR=1 FL=1
MPMADETVEQVSEAVEQDPVVEGSLNWPLTIAALALVLSTGWALYDAFVARQPWKAYQAAFVPAYGDYLHQVRDQQRTKEQEIEANDEYIQLQADYEAVRAQLEPERQQLGQRLALLALRMDANTTE